MIRLALPVLACTWLLQQFNTQFLLVLPAAAWAVAALIAWCLLGGRVALLLVACGLTIVRAGWLLESRLPDYLSGSDLLVRGVVCDFPRADAQATRLILYPQAGDGTLRLPARVHLSWYERAPLIRPGERWQLRVRLRPPRGLRNPGGFDFEQWLYARGVAASGYVRASALNRPLPPLPTACPVGTGRGYLAARIEEGLGAHPAAGLVLGVAVGATHRLDEADWELLRRTGTTHLLAISGLNIAMVAAPFLVAGPALGRILPALAGRPHAGIIPAAVAAALYSALSGFALSTVRALVMLLIAAALTLRRRRVEGVDLLAPAAVVVLVIDPVSVVTVSFWLSFLAVLGLFIAVAPAGTPAAERRGWRRLVASGIGLARAQLILVLGLAPVLLAWFQQVSLVAPFTNLVAVPVFSFAVMPLALLGSALVVPAPGAGGALLRLSADVVAALLALLSLAGDLRFSVWQPPAAGAPGLWLAGVAAMLLSWWRPLPLRSLALALLLPVVAGSAGPRPPLRVTVLDVGQGLAVLVETPRHALLYDAGPLFRLRDAGESVVVPAIRRTGIRRLDAMMISHDDQDHAGGAPAVLRAFPDATLIAPAGLRLRSKESRRCVAGLSWAWDGVFFTVISPGPADAARSENDGSCVLRIETRNFSVLLPGDIGRRREEELAGRGRLHAVDLLVAPHHGSRSSSGSALVAATRPRFVVVSAGHRNRWGFPAGEVRERWARSGACLLETAAAGAITFAIGDDGTFRLVRRERVDGARLWTSDAVPGDPCPDTPGH